MDIVENIKFHELDYNIQENMTNNNSNSSLENHDIGTETSAEKTDDLEQPDLHLYRKFKDNQTSDMIDENNVKPDFDIKNDLEKFKNLDKLEEMVVKIFPKLKELYESSNHSDEDNISLEESELRLIIIWFFLTTILCLVPLGQLLQILTRLKNPNIVEPMLPKNINGFGKFIF